MQVYGGPPKIEHLATLPITVNGTVGYCTVMPIRGFGVVMEFANGGVAVLPGICILNVTGRISGGHIAFVPVSGMGAPGEIKLHLVPETVQELEDRYPQSTGAVREAIAKELKKYGFQEEQIGTSDQAEQGNGGNDDGGGADSGQIGGDGAGSSRAGGTRKRSKLIRRRG